MGTIISYFNPNNIPAYLKEHDVISIWQEKALQLILLISAAAAWVGIILSALLKFKSDIPSIKYLS